MPIEVTLQDQISPGIFTARGKVTATNPRTTELISGEANVLVKVDKNQAMLHLDSALHPSTLLGKQVEVYILQEPASVKAPKVGDTITFHKVNFNIRK